MIRRWNWGGIHVGEKLLPSLAPGAGAASSVPFGRGKALDVTSCLWRRPFPPLPPSFTSLRRYRHGCGGADVRLAIHLSHREQRVASESEIQPTTAGHIAFIFFSTPQTLRPPEAILWCTFCLFCQ